MSSLFDVAENNITYHLQNIYNTKELEENRTTQKIRVVQKVGNRVSDECTIIANYKNTEVKDRFFKEKFVFKNIEYDRNKPYFLIITDEETGIEFTRIKFYIDIAIVNNFDF